MLEVLRFWFTKDLVRPAIYRPYLPYRTDGKRGRNMSKANHANRITRRWESSSGSVQVSLE